MHGDQSGGVNLAAAQDYQDGLGASLSLSFEFFNFFFLLTSPKKGYPALTAGRRMAMRRIAWRGRDFGHMNKNPAAGMIHSGRDKCN